MYEDSAHLVRGGGTLPGAKGEHALVPHASSIPGCHLSRIEALVWPLFPKAAVSVALGMLSPAYTSHPKTPSLLPSPTAAPGSGARAFVSPPSPAPSPSTPELYIDLYKNYYKWPFWKWMCIKRKVNSSAEPLNHKFLPQAHFYSPCENRSINGKSDTALTPAALGVVAECKVVTGFFFLRLLCKALSPKNHARHLHCRLLHSCFPDKWLF